MRTIALAYFTVPKQTTILVIRPPQHKRGTNRESFPWPPPFTMWPSFITFLRVFNILPQLQSRNQDSCRQKTGLWICRAPQSGMLAQGSGEHAKKYESHFNIKVYHNISKTKTKTSALLIHPENEACSGAMEHQNTSNHRFAACRASVSGDLPSRVPPSVETCAFSKHQLGMTSMLSMESTSFTRCPMDEKSLRLAMPSF